jgi:hypothetical protein
MQRPLAPETGYREDSHRPTPRPRRILRDVEGQADDGAGQPRRYPGEVMTCPRTSIKDEYLAPSARLAWRSSS